MHHAHEKTQSDTAIIAEQITGCTCVVHTSML